VRCARSASARLTHLRRASLWIPKLGYARLRLAVLPRGLYETQGAFRLRQLIAV